MEAAHLAVKLLLPEDTDATKDEMHLRFYTILARRWGVLGYVPGDLETRLQRMTEAQNV